MPTFLDGQQNLAALTVPGVYADIILPTPFLQGVPTNIEGLVGVAQWGPVNALIPATNLADASLSLGHPQIRSYDICSHIAAATQVGGSIGFYCVRVTDGTDTAATGTVQTGGTYATGTITFSGNPTVGDTLTLNGTVITFTTLLVGTTVAQTVANLTTLLDSSNDTNIDQATYFNQNNTDIIQVQYKTVGTGGNSWTMAKSSTAITLSGATLTGGSGSGGVGLTVTAKYTGTLGNSIQISFQNGTKAGTYMVVVSFPGTVPQQWNNIGGSGNAFWQAVASAINSGTNFSGPSRIVVATAGSSTLAPTLSAPVTLSGGTDGANGVVDATLMGTDTLPRKGMYTFRSAGIDSFTLIDHVSSSDWAAMGAFGLSENCLPIMSTPSGTAYQTTISEYQTSGDDTPWSWIISGDWPSFYDAYNGVVRLINPTAFAIGIVGNLSPQQSPLNKPLQGVVSTQTSALGEVYSNTDLSLINQGGIDVILPSTQSPGGFYYSFATGRNASSNTAANGIEYTRMTNFLVRAAQSKAAGSFIGRLQSIQPNDQTRQQASALFNSFSAQLASPEVGLGIDGQGMIDQWGVECDLNNNPPDLQARGYLFLYWQVRYLNVIRYFVVKFQGGGNVTVTVQNNAPAPSQFQTPINTIPTIG